MSYFENFASYVRCLAKKNFGLSLIAAQHLIFRVLLVIGGHMVLEKRVKEKIMEGLLKFFWRNLKFFKIIQNIAIQQFYKF